MLLTTAGMQQFKKYFTGELDPMRDFKSKNTASIQKSFRTSDIDEVGDESHLTFFEMLGNFSFGGYFKTDAIQYGHEFITKVMGLTIDYVSVFEGDKSVPADTESEEIWKSLGVKNIKRFGRADNFWGPTGGEGPCGPTTEIYVKNSLGHSIEIWNIVFNEYYSHGDKKLTKLETPGVDTGMGLERLTMVAQSVPTIFETDLFAPLISILPPTMPTNWKRIFADHARGTAFLISDGVRPSNKDTGYVLRRLMRRIISHEYMMEMGKILEEDEIQGLLERVLEETVLLYKKFYPELDLEAILTVFQEENEKFSKTVKKGIAELRRVKSIDAKTAFKLFESYGLPYETIKELGGDKAHGLERAHFDEEFKRHQEISRVGATKKFGGHGLILDTGELKAGSKEELKKVTRLHTATHLLHQALREVLGESVHQMGSDITVERTRFDFTFNRKVTPYEIVDIENIVNKKVEEDLPVHFKEMPKDEAERTGALHFFKEKYPEKVKVYYIGESLEEAYSKEFCGGPHVTHTGEIGKVKIVKEEAVGAGGRRIRATVL